MSLLNVINANPALTTLADANDVAGLLAAFNDRTIERTDHTLRGPALLTLALGQEAVAGLAYALQLAESQGGPTGAYYADLRAVYRSSGLDLAHEQTRAGIDSLVAGGLPAELGAALKGLGVWMVSLAEQDQGSQATEEQVSAALVDYSRAALVARCRARFNALVGSIEGGEVASIEEAVAFFGGA